MAGPAAKEVSQNQGKCPTRVPQCRWSKIETQVRSFGSIQLDVAIRTQEPAWLPPSAPAASRHALPCPRSCSLRPWAGQTEQPVFQQDYIRDPSRLRQLRWQQKVWLKY